MCQTTTSFSTFPRTLIEHRYVPRFARWPGATILTSVGTPPGCKRSSKHGPYWGDLIAVHRTTSIFRCSAGLREDRSRPQRRDGGLQHPRPNGRPRRSEAVHYAMRASLTTADTQDGLSPLSRTTTRSTSSGSHGRRVAERGAVRSWLLWQSGPSDCHRHPHRRRQDAGDSGARPGIASAGRPFRWGGFLPGVRRCGMDDAQRAVDFASGTPYP